MNEKKIPKMHPNLVNYALSYAKHGFSVIPIGNDKKPLIKYADKPPLTAKEIQAIWNKFPNANIALKTDKFFVIDVDRHDSDGMESIKKLGHDEWFKDTLTERTANNGYHFYFTKPSKVKIKQNVGFLPSVDIKGNKNNYVVVAPSMLGDKKYKWLNHKPMKEPSKELINLILKKQGSSSKKDFNLKVSYRTNGKNKTVELFEIIVNGLGTNGTRNNSLTSFVGSLLYRGVDPETTAKLAVIANNNTDNSLSLKEVEKTVNSVLKEEIKRRENLNE